MVTKKNMAILVSQRPLQTDAETIEEFREELTARGLSYEITEIISREEYERRMQEKLNATKYSKFLVRVSKAIYSKMENDYHKVRSGAGDVVGEVVVMARTKTEAIEVMQKSHPEFVGGFFYRVMTHREVLNERKNESKKNSGQQDS